MYKIESLFILKYAIHHVHIVWICKDFPTSLKEQCLQRMPKCASLSLSCFLWLVSRFFTLNTIYVKGYLSIDLISYCPIILRVYHYISIHLVVLYIIHWIRNLMQFLIPSQSPTLGGTFEWCSCSESTVTEIQSTRDLPSVWLYGIHSICP